MYSTATLFVAGRSFFLLFFHSFPLSSESHLHSSFVISPHFCFFFGYLNFPLSPPVDSGKFSVLSGITSSSPTFFTPTHAPSRGNIPRSHSFHSLNIIPWEKSKTRSQKRAKEKKERKKEKRTLQKGASIFFLLSPILRNNEKVLFEKDQRGQRGQRYRHSPRFKGNIFD